MTIKDELEKIAREADSQVYVHGLSSEAISAAVLRAYLLGLEKAKAVMLADDDEYDWHTNELFTVLENEAKA